MKNLVLVATLAVSGLANAYSPYTELTVNDLPARFPMSCTIGQVKLVERNGALQVNVYEEVEGYAGLTLSHRLRLKGEAAQDVSSAKLEMIKSGWFPKCALVLR